MNEFKFTTQFDATLSQNILKVIGYLYEHNKRDVMQDLARECALCDVRPLEKNNAIEEEKGVFRQSFTRLYDTRQEKDTKIILTGHSLG